MLISLLKASIFALLATLQSSTDNLKKKKKKRHNLPTQEKTKAAVMQTVYSDCGN